MYKSLFKHLLDFFGAFLLLIILSPLAFFASLALLVANKGDIFFTQRRPGKNGRIFRIIKFKTMRDSRDKEGNLLPDKERVTPVGQCIRKSSLDEIPQLINVLKGDMSLIGPRPLLEQYLPLYNDFQKRRHEVKPGITGWAQVNGRNNISWGKRFELDVYYIDHLSFFLDLKILWLTLQKVIQRKDVNQKGQATVQYFSGNEKAG